MADTYTTTITNEEKSTVKIEGEIPFAELEKHRAAAIQHLGKDVSIDGFRKGHVPEKILVQHVGEMAVLGEMAERALAKVYPDIVKEHELQVVGHPQVSLTKLAEGNPLGFTAVVAVMPQVSLPDYKALAAKETLQDVLVTEEEVEEAIKNLLRQKVAYERMQAKAAAGSSPDASDEVSKEKTTDGVVDLPTPDTVNTKNTSDKDGAQTDEPVTTQEEFDKLIPELTDEYVKTLGDFSSVEDFKTKLKAEITTQKEQETVQKHRSTITDVIIEESKMSVPQVMIDSEIEQMFGQMNADLTRANLKMDDYLEHIKKTKEDLIKEWTPMAEKRAKLQLVLNEIAKKEQVELDQGKVDHEVDHLLEHYKDADRERVRIYVETIMKNEEVMKILEKASEK